MSKAPAFQFYVRDWLSDPQLKMCSHATKGIWIDLLCFMWESPERGKIEGTIEQLARMVSANNGDFEHFLEEAKLTNFASVTVRSNFVTVKNRRMFRESRERKLHAERQDRYRKKLSDGPNDCKCDGDVTVPSSSSSSSSSSNTKNKEGEDPPFSLPSKEEIEQASEPMILSLAEKVSIQIHKEMIFPEVFAFKNKMVKQKKNPRSILHTLIRAYLKREFEEGPWPYCLKVIEIEDRKYNARDYGKTT